jgi:lysine 2,3-aminomutase
MESQPATLRRVGDLVRAGLIPEQADDRLEAVAARYAVAITPAMAALIDRDDPNDPIARQFVPDIRETRASPAETADPIGDHRHMPVKGIVHRYPDRVLLKPTHACPVYCRFCFRREMVGPGGDGLAPAELDAAIGYVAAHPAVWEVVITGGDPLMLAPRRLGEIVSRLSAIPHVEVIRLHSRVPVVDPDRVDDLLLEALRADKAVFLALHTNHPRELAAAAAAACGRIVAAGIPMVSQTVLLRGVNDDLAVLEALFRRLVALRVKPYYLHHADLAPGTSHLRVSLDRGRSLMQALRGRLSGLCQPHYVLDIPGGFGKVPVGPEFLKPAEAPGCWEVSDFRGALHRYVEDVQPALLFTK